MTIAIAQQYFLDPISGKFLTDPVINHCGHSYSRASLNQWKAHTKHNECPFCLAPFESLIDNVLIRQAVAIASALPHKEYTRVDQFTDEDREIVEVAIAQITKRRELDQAGNIPSKLDPYFGSSALDQAAAYSKTVSKKFSSC
jgi:hypothetical protein